MFIPTSFLHTLVVYTIVGSALAFLLSLTAGVVFNIRKPLLRIELLFLTLIIPLAAYFFHYYISPALGLEQGTIFFEPANRLLAYFCSLGLLGSEYYLPLLLFVVLGLYRLVVHFLYCRMMKLYTLPYEVESYRRPEEILAGLVKKAGLYPPQLRIVERKGYNCFTYGIHKSVIIVSKPLLEALNDDELQAVLAHELAHIKHRDCLKNWFAMLLRDLSFYSPFAHLALRALQSEQEVAADDLAIDLTGKPLVYAATLIKLWRKNHSIREKGLSPAPAFVREARISDRVGRVMKQENNNGRKSRMLLVSIGAIVVLSLAYVC